MKTGTPTPGLQSRDVVPDKALAGHSNDPPEQPKGRVFGRSPEPSRADSDTPQESENLAQASAPTAGTR